VILPVINLHLDCLDFRTQQLPRIYPCNLQVSLYLWIHQIARCIRRPLILIRISFGATYNPVHGFISKDRASGTRSKEIALTYMLVHVRLYRQPSRLMFVYVANNYAGQRVYALDPN
jgi:hypothetical protein